MSRLDEIKNKAKLTMDEMYENQSVGNPENHKNGQPNAQVHVQPSPQQINQPGKKSFQEVNDSASRGSVRENEDSAIKASKQFGNQIAEEIAIQAPRRYPIHQVYREPVRPERNCKMTFSLPEDIFKAFNDLYALRMVQGRKTEKSALICEAIELLLQLEAENHIR